MGEAICYRSLDRGDGAENKNSIVSMIFSTKHKRDESENKSLFLSASLTDSGWKVVNRNNVRMPCAAGINMIIDSQDTCDYILYGKDNKPLAIIEYVSSTSSLLDGRNKACSKANKLEASPFAFFTLGIIISPFSFS